jgi:hypothetical protein
VAPPVYIAALSHGLEGGPGLNFEIGLNDPAAPTKTYPFDIVVQLTYEGTAGSGTDYNALPATVTIPAGSLKVNLTAVGSQDQEVEFSETIVAKIGQGPYAVVARPPTVAKGRDFQHQVGIALNYLDDDDMGPPRPIGLIPSGGQMNSLEKDTRDAANEGNNLPVVGV